MPLFFRCVLVCLLLTSFVYGQAPVAQSSDLPDTILVCAPGLMDAAKPWVDYRSRQGHRIHVVSGNLTYEQIKSQIREIAKSKSITSIVLFGDAKPNGSPNPSQMTATTVPTFRVESKVIRKWKSEPDFATDHFYSDLDDDGSPDVALGRICADTPQQLDQIIRKIIAYETDDNFDTWRRRVNFIAGVGGFGVLADKIIEGSTKKFLTNGIPSYYNTSMTQASWRSVYSPDPRLFRPQTIEMMNQGCLAWVYMGHGQKRGLDYYLVPPRSGLPIFQQADVQKVNVRAGSPIAVFLACYTGAFADEEDCLAEDLLRTQRGPVAVVSGSNVTMPYAMTVMGNAMLKELFVERRETLGEVILRAKQELAKPTEASPSGLLDQLAKVISPDPDLLDEERAEHVRLFHLFGDPLTRIHHPRVIEIKVPEDAYSGDTIEISGKSELAGNGIVELVCRRDQTTFRAPARPKFEFNDGWLRSLQETYVNANDTTWTSTKIALPQGDFTTQLTVPENAKGLAHVRVYLRGAEDCAVGSADVYLRTRRQEPVASRKTDDAG